jgi:hypothetical protein
VGEPLGDGETEARASVAAGRRGIALRERLKEAAVGLGAEPIPVSRTVKRTMTPSQVSSTLVGGGPSRLRSEAEGRK